MAAGTVPNVPYWMLQAWNEETKIRNGLGPLVEDGGYICKSPSRPYWTNPSLKGVHKLGKPKNNHTPNVVWKM